MDAITMLGIWHIIAPPLIHIYGIVTPLCVLDFYYILYFILLVLSWCVCGECAISQYIVSTTTSLTNEPLYLRELKQTLGNILTNKEFVNIISYYLYCYVYFSVVVFFPLSVYIVIRRNYFFSLEMSVIIIISYLCYMALSSGRETIAVVYNTPFKKNTHTTVATIYSIFLLGVLVVFLWNLNNTRNITTRINLHTTV
jgi:hypothetical protein